MVPAHPVVMQPVHIHSIPVHPAPPILVTETWTVPGPLLPLPKHSSRRQRSEPEPFDAYDYPHHQSKLKDHSRAYDQHRARLEQPLHPKKAIEYQDHEQEADGRTYYSYDATAMSTDSETPSESLAKYEKEPSKSIRSQQVYTKRDSSKLRYVEYQPDAADEQAKWSSANRARTERKHTTRKPTSSQGVHTKGDSSKLAYGQKHIESPPDAADRQAKTSSATPVGTERKHTTKFKSTQRVHTKDDSSKSGHAQKYIESQPESADNQAKGSSAYPAGIEPKGTTKKLTSATYVKPDSKRRSEKEGEHTKERTSTNTTGTGRAHTTSHSSSNKFSIRPAGSQSGPKITINQHEGSSLKFKYDPKRWKFGISIPDEKSTGHRGKEKPKESSRGSRSKKPTKEEVPDYYAIIGCSKDDTFQTISSKIKKRQVELHPDKRVKCYMSEERIKEINRECALVNEAAEVLKDDQKKKAYDENWCLFYRVDKDGNTVSR